MELIPIELNMNTDSISDEYIQTMCAANLEYYQKIGFNKPWIAYLAKENGVYVGTCAFKGPPKAERVEIAYHTFPAHEGKGYASQMCKLLIDIAQSKEVAFITARTLPEKNASTKVLEKNRFECAGIVIDDDDGEVFEWIL